MSKDDALVLDLLRAARLAIDFTTGYSTQQFLDDLKTQSAVLHQLTLLGEQARRVTAEFRSAHPEVPWAAIAGLRNRIVHEYDSVDVDRVWEVVHRDLAPLIAALQAIAPRES